METVKENVEPTVPTEAAPADAVTEENPEPVSEPQGDLAPAPRAAYMSMLGNEAAQASRPVFLSYIRPGFWDDVHNV